MALVDFRADSHAAGDIVYRLRDGATETPAAEGRLLVEALERAVTVDIGCGRLVFPRTGGFRIEYERSDSTRHSRQSFVEVGVRDDRGDAALVELTDLRIEEEGPLRSVVFARAGVRRADGESLVDLIVRTHVFHGLAAVRCHVTVRNLRRARHAGGFWELGDEQSVFLTEMFVAVESLGTTAADTLCSIDEHAPLRVLGSPLSVYQDSSGGPNWRSAAHVNRFGQVRHRFRGYRMRGGLSDEHGLTRFARGGSSRRRRRSVGNRQALLAKFPNRRRSGRTTDHVASPGASIRRSARAPGRGAEDI